jgi:mannose-6-phosphate isomerase-like protein (cupin superfamily)/DNA-binding XRE family transcriptional regulator
MKDRSTSAVQGRDGILGPRIRAVRQSRGLSLRELARRTGISASALSQIETAKTRPTVKTAYDISQQLGVTLAELSAWLPAPSGAERPAAADTPDARPPVTGPAHGISGHAGADGPSNDGAAAHLSRAVEFIPRGAQQSVDLQGGEQFRVLSGHSLPGASCLLLTYAPGAVSPPGDDFVRHAGHEFNYLVAGRLQIEVGAQRFDLAPGDTLTFPATTPHRLSNPWEETAELLCLFVRTSAP